jgi:hypothetical protein
VFSQLAAGGGFTWLRKEKTAKFCGLKSGECKMEGLGAWERNLFGMDTYFLAIAPATGLSHRPSDFKRGVQRRERRGPCLSLASGEGEKFGAKPMLVAGTWTHETTQSGGTSTGNPKALH